MKTRTKKTFQVIACRIAEPPTVERMDAEQIAAFTGGRGHEVIRPRTLRGQGDDCPLPESFAIVADATGRLHHEAAVNRFGVFGDFMIFRRVGNTITGLTDAQVEQALAAVREADAN